MDPTARTGIWLVIGIDGIGKGAESSPIWKSYTFAEFEPKPSYLAQDYAKILILASFPTLIRLYGFQSSPKKNNYMGEENWKFGVARQSAGAFCGNPSSDVAPWCYSLSPDNRWDWCLPEC